jgi:apolipoprotein N-acyltransferase|uniref:Apolipoprotein N-acyltransferase n=1 Tax=Desulfobacca acetoxidans TaxID=60893 RepID=A0A7V6DQH2_9BACT
MFVSLLAAVLSGFLLVVAFPRYDQSLLLFVALIPLLWALKGQSRQAGFWLGFVNGVVFYLGLLSWIFFVTYVYGHLPLPVALGVLLLLACYLAIYRGLWAWGVVWAEKQGVNLLWFAPVLWVVLEFAQGYPISSFPWELLGDGLYRQPVLVQAADLIGTHGLSFLLVLINMAVVVIFSPATRNRPPGRVTALLVLIMVLAAWIGYGTYRRGTVAASIAQSPKIRTAVIQGNIEQSEKWDPKMVQSTLETYAKLTRETLARKNWTEDAANPPLVIWPETAAPFFFNHKPGGNASWDLLVQNIARENKCYLLFGAPAMEETPKGELLYNRAYLLNPQGEVVGHYDKSHLVPFGEYVPFGRVLFFISKLVPQIGDFVEGPVGATLTLPQGKIGVLICYESIFGYLSRAQVENGAHLLVNITNDAWFGATSAPYQHMSMAVLRAVENRVSLARAANTGISACMSGDGRILWTSPLDQQAGHAMELPWLPGGSFYTRYGYLFPWVCVALATLVFLFARRRIRW